MKLQTRSPSYVVEPWCYDAGAEIKQHRNALPASRVKRRRRSSRIENVPFVSAGCMAFVVVYVLIYPPVDIPSAFSGGDAYSGGYMASTQTFRRLNSNTSATIQAARRLEESSCGESGSTPSEDGALSGYPDTPFTIDEYKKGGVILPLFIIFVIFYGLAVVCDKYFEPALEAICDNLHLGPDVAGATFMAAGGSAPELATSTLGVFVSKSDIGIGTIVGSAVFNVLFVIATCAFVAPNLKVTWYPLARDCIYYCMSILTLAIIVLDTWVKWYEACILFLLYVIYCTMMGFNEQLEAKALDFVAQERHPNKLQLGIVREERWYKYIIYATIVVNIVMTVGYEDEDEYPWAKIVNHVCAGIFVFEFLGKQYGFGLVAYWKSPADSFDGVLVALIGVEYVLAGGGMLGAFRGLKFLKFLRFLRMLRILRQIKLQPVECADASTQTGESDSDDDDTTKVIKVPRPENFIPVLPVHAEPTALMDPTPIGSGGMSTNKKPEPEILPGGVPDTRNENGAKNANPKPAPSTKHNDDDTPTPEAIVGDTGGDDGEVKVDGEGDAESDESDDGPFNPFEHGEGIVKTIWWAITLPLVLCMFFTIPDCKNPRFAKLWVLTFILCIVWIAALAYVMVWMATIFGVVSGIPDPVMGLTLLAAGTSIPDALSSLAVARKGQGDMAVSSSVGSNIFDILVGLPVPWMLYAAFNNGASTQICSDSVSMMIITLFIMVAVVVCMINVEKWQLTMRLGYVYLGLYFAFVTLSLLLEYKVGPFDMSGKTTTTTTHV